MHLKGTLEPAPNTQNPRRAGASVASQTEEAVQTFQRPPLQNRSLLFLRRKFRRRSDKQVVSPKGIDNKRLVRCSNRVVDVVARFAILSQSDKVQEVLYALGTPD